MKTLMRTTASSLVVAFLGLGLTSCDGVLIPSTLEFPREFTFAFDSNAGLTRTASLTRDDILGQIDLPADARIEAVDIQNLKLSLDATPTTNTASSANISFSYLGTNLATVTGVAAVDSDSVPILANAVGTLRTNAEAMLRGDAGAPSQITVTSTVSGIAPSGARLVLDATLTVTMTLTYSDCVDIGLGPLGPSGECVVIDP